MAIYCNWYWGDQHHYCGLVAMPHRRRSQWRKVNMPHRGQFERSNAVLSCCNPRRARGLDSRNPAWCQVARLVTETRDISANDSNLLLCIPVCITTEVTHNPHIVILSRTSLVPLHPRIASLHENRVRPSCWIVHHNDVKAMMLVIRVPGTESRVQRSSILMLDL